MNEDKPVVSFRATIGAIGLMCVLAAGLLLCVIFVAAFGG